MNKGQNKFVKRVKNRFLFKLFTIAKLPLGFIAGLKVLDLDENQCSTSVGYKYLNKNPFQSTYFAVLNMAAELSTGILALLATKGRDPSVAVIIVSMKSDFQKKATDTITFTCSDGEKLFRAVDKAIETKEPQTATVATVGKNKNGEIVSTCKFTWSFKERS
jgi:hypothetical protein|tara:strand:- start:1221 stop:1706 length:486 start_codon:yes stop_codon:yes gene_type:complete